MREPSSCCGMHMSDAYLFGTGQTLTTVASRSLCRTAERSRSLRSTEGFATSHATGVVLGRSAVIDVCVATTNARDGGRSRRRRSKSTASRGKHAD